MTTAKKANTLDTMVEGDVFIRIDCDKALPVMLYTLGSKKGHEKLLWRPVTLEEKREIVYCSLAYGRSPILYRLWRLLILSITKRLYPQQGSPKIPLTKEGVDMTPVGSTRNRT